MANGFHRGNSEQPSERDALSLQWLAINEKSSGSTDDTLNHIEMQWAYYPARQDFKTDGSGHHPRGYHAHYAVQDSYGINADELAMMRHLKQVLQDETKGLMQRMGQWLKAFDPSLKTDPQQEI